MLRTKTQYLTTSALLVAVTAVCAQIMLPLGAVQFSMQIFAVLLAALLLPPLWASGSMLAYLLLGLAGAPVFGGFRGGPSVLFGVTGGFLLVFPFMALYVSLLAEKLNAKKAIVLFGILASSLILCYIVGCGWFSLLTHASLDKAFLAAVLPFIIPDLLKAAAAAWLAPLLIKRLRAVT